MYIWVDEGEEFYNKDRTAWLKDRNITRYSTHGEHKSAIAERFNRTLKQRGILSKSRKQNVEIQ